MKRKKHLKVRERSEHLKGDGQVVMKRRKTEDRSQRDFVISGILHHKERLCDASFTERQYWFRTWVQNFSESSHQKE